ncbi:hypothetical protein [Aerosakkonema funiforme]|uniref:hypothetical protein n=1 Tax=Aerosakkonema funiforme TaxID=1246630 RepID=UPI0016841799|nr:hypothetical protein [Aerosakkonema funiforme]
MADRQQAEVLRNLDFTSADTTHSLVAIRGTASLRLRCISFTPALPGRPTGIPNTIVLRDTLMLGFYSRFYYLRIMSLTSRRVYPYL